MMESEEETMIRRIVRDELARIEEKRQAACTHARSGTLDSVTGELKCDDCGGLIDDEAGPPPDVGGGMSFEMIG